MSEPRHIFITGATGFIGGAIARRWAALGLGRLGEARVRTLARRSDAPETTWLREAGVEVLPGDPAEPESWARALHGCDVVVHAAAEKRGAHVEQIWRMDVEVTRSLFEAAARAGVRRFIFISALGISGRENGLLTEEADPQLTGDLYHDAKLAAEMALHELSGKPGAPALAILRFPAVYGPGSERWSESPLRRAVRGQLFVPGRGEFPFAYLFVDNMVDAVTAAAATEIEGVYNIFDGVSPYAGFMRYYADMAGTRLRHRALALQRGLVTLREWVGWLVGRYPVLNRRALEIMLQPIDAASRAEKAQRELSWRPRLSLAEGMAVIEQQNGFHRPGRRQNPWDENEEWRSGTG